MSKYIVVEGLEGAGKSTVMGLIKDCLQSAAIDFIETREPGGTPMAEAIRDCVKHDWQESVCAETELLLMYAARAQLVNGLIKPALQNQQWVLSDRFDWSSIAYQGGGRQIDMAKLASLQQLVLGDFQPDLVIYLDIDPTIGLQRARGRGELDRIESSGLAFFQRTREMYLHLVKTHDYAYKIDAGQPIEQVHAEVLNCVQRFIEAQ